jgi:hypothetical protein
MSSKGCKYEIFERVKNETIISQRGSKDNENIILATFVIPAKAGIQNNKNPGFRVKHGMTVMTVRSTFR